MDKVFFTYRIPEEASLLLKRYQLIINEEDRFLSKKELIEKGKDASALVTLLSDNIDREVIESLPKLKIIANYAVGYNNIDVNAATERGIKVTNTPGVLTDATANLTMALLLASARRIIEGDHMVRSSRFNGWKPELLQGQGLTGKILGIVGLGRIGKAVAMRAKAFGMEVIYCKRRPLSLDEENELGIKSVSLEDLLKTSDFVSLHVPLTGETRHMINAGKLKLMKPSSILINTSRGPVIDEEALIEVLKERKIFGAGLDVYENEPEVPYAMKQLDNVVLLPHIGTATFETRREMAIMVAKNVAAVLEGREAPNKVNL